jgi:acetyltransferase-like isoleucine patch superfamily enzyme
MSDIDGDWDYSDLPENVVLGHDCFIERRESFALFRSKMNPGLVLGDRVSAYTWTTFNVEPGGAVCVGEDSVLVGAVFMCAEQVTIGKRVVVSYQVTIADSDFHPKDPDLRIADALANAPGGNRGNRPAVTSRPVVIEDDVWIGIGSIVLKGVTIGAGARIEAGSVVASDVAPGTVVKGNPARVADR